MKATTASALVGALLLPLGANALPAELVEVEKRDVDTRYPYKGPVTPVGDWVNNNVVSNGKGFPRLVEPPAVTPAEDHPTNNVNVIAVSYIPKGVNIRYQTPFGLGASPTVKWGLDQSVGDTATGTTMTYDRTPPCSQESVLLCNQFFHDVQINNLKPATTYYYQIPAANGTTESEVLKFTTAREAGDTTPFGMAILNDMGYTNAMGTYKQLMAGIQAGDINFAWHGGDISYADDWYSGVLACQKSWDVCYNGSHSRLPVKVTNYYKDHPLPAGEIPNQGSPTGGDFSTIYESNWDLWQQWFNQITTKIPYMVLPGNHEAACAEFDGPHHILTAYLNKDEANSSASKSQLNYYSCPPSQRNFTAYSNRFRMPGPESGGVDNFWYSYDYGLVHFVSIDTETDYAYSPEEPFIRVTGGNGLPTRNQTYVTNSGPFGYINGSYEETSSYEQYNWLKADLEAVDRSKTPWVLVMGHRPMYSSQVSSYQANIRAAFQELLIENGVDVYLAGHIHWYERMYPLTVNGTVDNSAVINNHTYQVNQGKSLIHLTNGMAGNIESHSTLGSDPILNITAHLNLKEYGFNHLKVTQDQLTFSFMPGNGDGAADYVNVNKPASGYTKRETLGQE